MLAAARAAALAAREWVGRGDKESADGAATDAMRRILGDLPGTGTVVIGEGEKDEAPMLHNGEQLGKGNGPDIDIAVDPVEGTNLTASGMGGALTTIAASSKGTMWSPGPALYMDKIVVGPAARDAIDLREEPEHNIEKIAAALGCSVGDVRVVVLQKPRHKELIERLHAMGAQVRTPSDGDVAGALLAVAPDGDADVLLGIGGTPEGVMTACAVRELKGGMQGRLAPQRDPEARAVRDAGFDVDRVLDLEDLVSGPALFAATGLTDGPLLRGPWTDDGYDWTESFVVRSGAMRRIVEATPVPAS